MVPADRSIIVVEDEELLIEVLMDVLASMGLKANFFRSCEEAGNVSACDLAFIDHSLPDGNGSDLLPDLRSRFPQARLLLMTGHPLSNFPPATQSFIDGVLIKPFTVDEFETILLRNLS